MLQIEDKIDSPLQLEEVLGDYKVSTYKALLATTYGMLISQIHWWCVRETHRKKVGFYESTEALDKLNKISPFSFAHISRKDRNMVAFTPDKASGEADRQVITTFGRLASKLMPFVTDDYIRDLTAEHMGDISNDIEFLEGQAIVDAYGMKEGFPSSCMMAGSPTAKAWPEGLAPSQAYMMPNIKMAVLRDPNDPAVIVARSMVVEVNGEKRYIRANYGDPKLERRLIRAGYIKSGWMDVEFNMVPYESSELKREGAVRFLMPYLDAFGSTCKTVGSGLIYMNGKLKGINQDTHTKLERAGLLSYLTIPSTRGWIDVVPVEEEFYMITDIVTGLKINRLEESPIEVNYNGQRGWTLHEKDNWVLLSDLDPVTSLRTRTYWPVDTKQFYSGFDWVDNDRNRKHKGFVKLSAEYYPDQCNEWVHNWTVTEFIDSEGNAQVAKSEDLVFWVQNNILTHKFKSKLQKSDVKLVKDVDRGLDCYVPKGELIYRSASGRKVHPEYNNVRLRWDGIYDFKRNVICTTVWGQDTFIARKGHDRTAYAEWKKQILVKRVEDAGPSIGSKALRLFQIFGDDWAQHTYDYKGTRLYRRPSECCEAMCLDELATMLKAWKAGWLYDSEAKRARNTSIDALLYEIAEAQALDYNQLPQVTHEQIQAAIIDAEVQQPEVVCDDHPL